MRPGLPCPSFIGVLGAHGPVFNPGQPLCPGHLQHTPGVPCRLQRIPGKMDGPTRSETGSQSRWNRHSQHMLIITAFTTKSSQDAKHHHYQQASWLQGSRDRLTVTYAPSHSGVIPGPWRMLPCWVLRTRHVLPLPSLLFLRTHAHLSQWQSLRIAVHGEFHLVLLPPSTGILGGPYPTLV